MVSTKPKGVPGRTGQLHPHGLHLGVLVDSVDAILAADTTGPETAKGHVGCDDPIGVDPDGSGAQLRGNAVRPVYVLGPHRGSETKRRGVGQLQRLLLVGERVGGENRPEEQENLRA